MLVSKMLSQDEGKNKDEAKMSRYKKGKIVSLLPQNLFKLGIHLYEEEEENEMQNRKFVVRLQLQYKSFRFWKYLCT